MAKRWVYLGMIALVLTGFFVFTSVTSQEEIEKISEVLSDSVIINLSVNSKKPELDVSIKIPVTYLGPKFLDFSKRNRIGGEQKRVIVQFYYPSLLPNTLENASLKEREILTYASVTTGVPGSTRRIALWYVEGNRQKSPLYPTYKGKICGLLEYKFTKKIPLDRYAFYYKNKEIDDNGNINTLKDNIYSDDVFIVCDLTGTPVDGIDRCNFTFDTKTGLSVDLRGVPMSRLCDWPKMTMKIRTLLDGFVIKKES